MLVTTTHASSSSDRELRLRRITKLPEGFDDIVEVSMREEFGAIQRMRDEWDSGANRFDRHGEALFEVRMGSRLVGICGLNRDPYTQSASVGRDTSTCIQNFSVVELAD